MGFVKTTYKSELDTRSGARVWFILKACNNEFVPPLGERSSTSQTDFNAEPPENPMTGLADYFKDMSQQKFILASVDDSIVGFLSFKKRNPAHAPLKAFSPANYVTTICVLPEYRQLGVSGALYRTLMHALPEKENQEFITTRTWSSNTPHQALLKKLGFRLIDTIQDDRGPGVDTLYYGRTAPDLKQPSIILLSGTPGSGKSYVGKKWPGK